MLLKFKKCFLKFFHCNKRYYMFNKWDAELSTIFAKMCKWKKYDWESDLLGMNGWLCDFNMFLSTYLIFFCLPKTQLWLFIQSMMGMSVKSRNKLLELRLTIANMSPIILCWKISCRVGTMSLSYEYFCVNFTLSYF